MVASWVLPRAVTRIEPEMIWMCANSRSPQAENVQPETVTSSDQSSMCTASIR